MKRLRRWFFAGLLIWIPLGVTFLVISFLVGIMDRTLVLLPAAYQPDELLGRHIPGLGLILTAAIVLLTGAFVANLFGRRLVELWERILSRIPLVRSIYAGAKQVAEHVFSDDGQAFKKVVMIQYPRAGLWSLGFQTSDRLGEVQARTRREHVSVFIPTTPNPTSGFIVMVPLEEVIELTMPVDQALQMIISLGVVVPPFDAANGAGEGPLAPLPPSP